MSKKRVLSKKSTGTNLVIKVPSVQLEKSKKQAVSTDEADDRNNYPVVFTNRKQNVVMTSKEQENQDKFIKALQNDVETNRLRSRSYHKFISTPRKEYDRRPSQLSNSSLRRPGKQIDPGKAEPLCSINMLDVPDYIEEHRNDKSSTENRNKYTGK